MQDARSDRCVKAERKTIVLSRTTLVDSSIHLSKIHSSRQVNDRLMSGKSQSKLREDMVSLLRTFDLVLALPGEALPAISIEAPGAKRISACKAGWARKKAAGDSKYSRTVQTVL